MILALAFFAIQAFADPLPLKTIYVGEEKGIYIDDKFGGAWFHVRYYTPDEQARATVESVKGKLAFPCGELLTGNYIYVVTTDKRLIVSDSPKMGELHHSSLSGGQPVMAAGTMKCKDGVVVRITDLSGHYHPTEEHYRYACKLIKGLK